MVFWLYKYWYWFVLGIPALFYLGIPLVIRSKIRMDAHPEYLKIDLNDPILPQQVGDYFREAASELEPSGFEVVQAVSMPNPASGVTAFYLLLSHRPNKDYALVTVMYARAAAMGAEDSEVARASVASSEFFSRFQDGSQLCTTNGSYVPPFSPGPSTSVERFPMVEDPGKLYRLHQMLLQRHEGVSPKFLRVDEFQGDVGAYLSQVNREQLNEQITAGYFYLSEEEQVYRPTLKGAYLMTWRQFEPFKKLAQTRIRNRAARLLRELEVSDLGS
jgi:hypothetical protein